jgi:hypothetical protein
MKKSFEFTQREIDEDVRAHVSRVFHEARWIIKELILPDAEIKSPTIDETTACPLALMMRDVLDHAAGMREVPDVSGICNHMLHVLFLTGEIPTTFWTSPVGAAISECSGTLTGISDETQLSEPEAARFLGVGQLTLLGYCQSGGLRPHRRLGPRRIFTAGQLREFRKQRYGLKNE